MLVCVCACMLVCECVCVCMLVSEGGCVCVCVGVGVCVCVWRKWLIFPLETMRGKKPGRYTLPLHTGCILRGVDSDLSIRLLYSNGRRQLVI